MSTFDHRFRETVSHQQPHELNSNLHFRDDLRTVNNKSR